MFPAMKPEETMSSRISGPEVVQQGATSIKPESGIPAPYTPPVAPIYATGSKLLEGVNVASTTGLKKLEVLILSPSVAWRSRVMLLLFEVFSNHGI